MANIRLDGKHGMERVDKAEWKDLDQLAKVLPNKQETNWELFGWKHF